MRPAALLLVALFPAASLPAQTIRARVIDDAARQPIAAATVTLLSAGAVVTRAATDANGFFQIRPAAQGDYEVTVERIGYATERRAIAWKGEALLLPAFVLKTEAVALDPVEATARKEASATGTVGFSRAAHVVAGARLLLLEEHAARPLTVVREFGSLRVREFVLPGGQPYICVEARRGIQSMTRRANDCDWPVIVIDDIVVANPVSAYDTFRNLHLRDMESFEFMTPADAGTRYGMDASSNGALVIWTRGRGPHRAAARNGGK